MPKGSFVKPHSGLGGLEGLYGQGGSSCCEARNKEVVQLNAWLKDWSRREGFIFLDHWEVFKKGWNLYKEGRSHLNWKGTSILAGSFASAVRVGLN